MILARTPNLPKKELSEVRARRKGGVGGIPPRQSVSGGERRGEFTGRGSRQKKFGFCPKGTAKFYIQRN